MEFRLFRRLYWLVPLLIQILLVPCISTEIIVDENAFDDTEAEHEPALVMQHTRVSRRRRSVSSFEQPESFVESYEFPEKMSFVVQARGHTVFLNLTRNTYARTDIHLSDNNGEIKTDFEFRCGVYNSVENNASVLVECRDGVCSLLGSLEINGELFHIEQDYSSKNLKSHIIRRRALPSLDQLKKILFKVTPEEDTSIDKPIISAAGNIRRRRSVVPDCDIIEVKTLVDDTMWEFYKDKFGGDETRAENEIQRYLASIFAEVDFRLDCLTGYFKAVQGCATNCIRAILVAVEITKTSSWTDGKTFTSVAPDGTTGTFVKGIPGVEKCGKLNILMTGFENKWDHLACLTRENIALKPSGIWLDYFRSVSYRPSVCHPKAKFRTSINEAKGDGLEIQLTHSLMHAVNADDDEDTDCAENEKYLMTDWMSKKTKNPAFWRQNWYLSGCMANDVCTYIGGLSPNCLRERGSFDEESWKEWEKVPLPGEIYSTDQQCKDKWGNDSVQCDPEGKGNLFPEFMCSRYIYCTLGGSCVCQVRVTSGTPCGKAKTCQKGHCLPTPDIPLGGTCDCHSQCADDNAVCDPHTCKCVCADGYYDDNGDDVDGGNCTEKVPIDEPCDEDRECLDPNAICVDDTCQCRPCYYNRNGTCMEQSCLGDTCDSDEQCKGDSVECDPERNICICENGYFVNDEGKCVKVNGTLCDPCIQEPNTCTQRDTECNARGFCQCIFATVTVDGECYGTRVGQRCTNVVNTCIDDYAECNGTICVCADGFVWNGTRCVGDNLCDPCDPAISTCVCSLDSYRCVCPRDQVQIGDNCYGTRVSEVCTTSLDTCIDDYAICNGTICNCRPGFTWNGTRCVGTDPCDPCDPTTVPCQSPFVCGPNSYVCECPSDKVQIDEGCYGTRVTEECTNVLNTCIDKYAECNGTICNCINGYTWNGTYCLGPDICDPCDLSTPSCDTSLVCNPSTYRCECPPNKVQIGSNCYGTRVTEECTVTLNTCSDNHATCNGTICVCEPGFIWNGTRCIGEDLCDPCDPSTPSCADSLVCSPDTYRCECPSNQVQIGHACYGTRVTEDCTTETDTCVDDNAECNGTVCNCMSGFIWNGSICVGENLCEHCDPSTPSCGPGLVCSPDSYRCECPSDRVQIGDTCYGTRVTEPCTTDLDTCTDKYADCNGTVCDCIAGFIWNGSYCVGEDLCNPCDPSTPTCGSGLVCSPESYRCECPTDEVQIGDACYGTLVTEVCTNVIDTCADENAECNGTVCDCKPGFIWNGTHCLGNQLCDPCDPSTPTCAIGLVCSADTYRCECPVDQVQIGGACYGTRVTESCTTSLDTCTDKYAECNGTICDCVAGFTWNGTYCVGESLCDPCDPSASTCAAPLVCSSEKYKCVCPTGQVQIGDACYGTLVTEACTSILDTCVDKNAECNGTVCDCVPGFIWNGTKCVGPFLCDPCDPSTPSCDASLVCSEVTYRCECPADEVQIGDDCYGTRVTESCTNALPTCIDRNANCNGTTCVCNPPFVWNGTICVGTVLCDPCDPAISSCGSPLVCSSDTYRCECPPNQVQIGDACYGTRVTEDCTTLLDTCVDCYANCNGTVCDCMPGFIWNGTNCLGDDLCEPCDPSTPTCGPGLVCSPQSYSCECPTDQVQIGDACYGTRVTESCTTTLNTCTDHHAVCNGTVCDCVSGFTWNGSICVGKDPCDPCDPATPSCGPPLVCSPDSYVCECPPDRVQIEDDCYGTRVTEVCTNVLNTCIDDYAICNGTVCDCISGFIWNGTRCVGPNVCDPCDPSTPSCDSSLVCSADTYRCECPSDRVQIGDMCYGTLVMEVCTTALDTCIDDNAECNGTICDCMAGFTWNGTKCVGSNLCDPCDPSTPSCDTDLVCSPDTYRCECPTGQVQIGDACYGRLVTEVCTQSLDTCIDDYAVCNGTICDCIPGFIWNGTFCVGQNLCDPCDPLTPSCTSGLVCSSDTYKCECPNNQVQIADDCYGTRVTEACTTILDTCIDDNAKCNGTICNCVSGFVWNGTRCVGQYLCDPCDPSTPSCASGLVCSDDTYRCECPSNQVQIGDNCYGTRVSEVCTQTLDTCIDDKAECNGTICDCMEGFTWNGFLCVGVNIGDPCSGDDPCTPPFICSNESICVCPATSVQIGQNCYGRLVSEDCTPALDTCIDKYADCNGTVCDCIPGFVWNGTICGGQFLCDPCDPSASTCNSELVCSPVTYKCECPANQVQIGDDCYGTRVTEVCTTETDTCIDDNANCNGTICDCMPGFTWNGTLCAGQDLCDPCDPSTPTCNFQLECSPNTYKCECPSNRVQIGDACYGTLVGESCTPQLDTCTDLFAVCNGTICDCMAGFTWNGTDCVGTSLCDPCDPSASTCSSPLVCSSDSSTCECPQGQVQIGDSCYGRLVTELCTSMLDTCINDNAVCNGTVCVCESGFTWNGTDCVGEDLCDQCDPSMSTCLSHLNCSSESYRCECPSGQVQIGHACYGTRVTDSCTNILDTCIDDNAKCNGTVCDCMTGFTWNGSVCVGDSLCDPCDPSDSTCASTLVCSANTYRCECPSGQVQISDMCYGTLVGEPCTNSVNTCTDKYATCNGTICDCIPGFIWNGTYCVGPDACDPCDPSTPSCGPGLECSTDTYKCECPSGTVQIGTTCYGTRVTETCTQTLDTCIDDKAMCNGTICDCMPGFTWNGTICVGTDLCDPCDPSISTCAATLVCSSDTYRCECPSDQVQIGDACYGTLVTESCTPALDTCVDKNADCNGTVCDCAAGFIWNGTHCVGQNLCDPCDPSTPSCASELVCSAESYTCECPTNQVQIGDACYGTRVTETCTSTLNTCVDDNAICNGTICDCKPGFTWNGSICVGENLCDPCDPSTPSCDPSLECSSETYRCECPSGHVQIGDDCYGTRVEDKCTASTDTCIDDNAICNGTICNCLPGFIWNGSICLGDELCEPCDPSTPSCGAGLVCSSDSYRCECPANRVQVGDACYGVIVTEPCTNALDTCVDDNAACNGSVCECIPPFTWNGTICVGPDICNPCDQSTLACASGLVCSSVTYKCECPTDRVQIGDECYGTRIAEPCTTTLPTCIDDKAECNGTVCVCMSGFIWNGTRCVGDDLCDPCDPSTPSCSSSLVCSPDTYRCECPADEVQIGHACYGRLVSEQCTTTLDTCIDDNAECNGTVCDCMAGFTWNGSICAGEDLCEPCDPSASTCLSPLVCSSNTYRCECPADRVQIGNACYGTRVTESCTTSTDTCVDDNAGCNGTICDCNDGFIWNGTICLGDGLWDPCDPSTPTCSSPLTCSSTNYRCECPSNNVQVGEACYGTVVGESCTPSTDTCIDDNAGCDGSVCACLPGFAWNGTKCVGKSLCDPCDPANNTCDSSLVCSSQTYRCECPADRVQIGDACYGTLVSEPCTTDLNTCTDDNAVCNGTVCDCGPGFTWNGTFCLGSELCDQCDPSTPTCGSGLVCSPASYKCECPADRVQIGDACYGRLIGEPCLASVDTCIDDNAICNGAVCECMPPFTWNPILQLCVGISLDDPCDATSCMAGLTCGATSQRCECDTPLQVQIDNVCYGTRIGEACTSAQDTCIDDNAGCLGVVCACDTDFTWNGLICVGKTIDDPCDDSANSCVANGLVCGPTDRCECPADEVQFNNMCYNLTCEPCTDNDDCLGNQVCLNSECRCDTDSYLDLCGICQPKVTNGGSCTSDEQCVSGICACLICVASLDDDCCEDCDDVRSDIIVITDNAGGSPSRYNTIKNFAITLVNAFSVSPSETQIGLVDYDDNVNNPNSFELDELTNILELTDELISNNFDGGVRRTHLALYEAEDFFNLPSNRDNVNNFVVVILGDDSCCPSSLATAIASLNTISDLTIYAVGVDNNVPLSELQAIATDNSKAFPTAENSVLETIVADIVDNSCVDGIVFPSTTTTTTTPAPTTTDDK